MASMTGALKRSLLVWTGQYPEFQGFGVVVFANGVGEWVHALLRHFVCWRAIRPINSLSYVGPLNRLIHGEYFIRAYVI